MIRAALVITACLALPVCAVAQPPGGKLDLAEVERAATAEIGSGTGSYPALTPPDRLAVPDPEALAAAVKWAHTRGTIVSFAVADPAGEVVGFDTDRPFRAASLTKAMILVAHLRRAEAENEPPDTNDLRKLGYMIRVSDNSSANDIYERTGDAALRVLALDAGMTTFLIDGNWAEATVTAADQARFFARLDSLVPRRYGPLAYSLLEAVVPFQSWGIPAVARPRWRVFFKGGWRPDSDGSLVNQGALLQSGGRRVGLAVLTDGNPGEEHGRSTIAGITARLLGGPGATAIPVGPAVVPGRLAPIIDLRGVRSPSPPDLVSLDQTR